MILSQIILKQGSKMGLFVCLLPFLYGCYTVTEEFQLSELQCKKIRYERLAERAEKDGNRLEFQDATLADHQYRLAKKYRNKAARIEKKLLETPCN